MAARCGHGHARGGGEAGPRYLVITPILQAPPAQEPQRPNPNPNPDPNPDQVKPVLAPKSLNAFKSFRPIAANDDAQVLLASPAPPPPSPTHRVRSFRTLGAHRTLRAALTR